MLPEGWKEVSLEKLAKIERGKFSARPRNDPKFYNGATPFVQTGDISSAGTYLEKYTQTLNDMGVKVSKIFPKGTILITIAANIGDTAITKFDVACPDSIVGIQCYSEKCNKIWLKLKLDTIKNNLDNDAGKNAQKNINLQVLKPLKILTPPLPEQEKIAAILSTWDKAISTTDALLANSRQQKKAIMQQLLTGKRRLPGFTGEWKNILLSDIAMRLSERNNGNSNNVVTISAQKGLIRQEEFFNKSIASESLDSYFLLCKGQFAYNKSYSIGYPMGAIKRLKLYETGVVTSLYICFDITSMQADANFYEHFFESGLLNAALTKIAAEGGRAHGLLNVRPADFMHISVPLPPLDEQRAIAAVLDAADREISLLEQKAARLRGEKKALMQQLLTGKRQVRL